MCYIYRYIYIYIHICGSYNNKVYLYIYRILAHYI